MRILLTGPDGYLAQALRKNTNLNFVYEKNAYGDIIETDITNIERFQDMTYDIILHNAGIVGTTNCAMSKYTLDVNINGTLNMIDLAIKKNVPLIFLSTTVIYEPTHLYITEDSKINPQTLYGKTKYLGEVLIKSLMKKFIIIRPCMIFGPNDKHSAITMAMTSTKENPKTIHLNPMFEKPYLHVDEFVRGIKMIIKNHKMLLGLDLNFAPIVHHPVEEILKFVTQLSKNRTYKLDMQGDYLGHHRLYGDKISKYADWQQKTNLFEDIEKTYDALK